MPDLFSLLLWGFVIFAIFGGGIFAGAQSLIKQWQLARRKEQEIDLKRDMVAKGFSPAEIERVIQARPGAAMPTAGVDDLRLPTHPAQGFDSGTGKANLVAALAEQGMDAEGIEGILKALGESADDELPGKVAAVHRMVEQGMDAEGIERIIRALGPPAAPRGKDETAFKE
jgi:SOS response regulatory protein OraA/RecX